MARLCYCIWMSLDGFTEDARGSFDWTEPDEEVNSFINGRMRQFGTYLYGRRMYDAMKVWEAHDFLQGRPGYMRDFGDVWRSADKIVYSQSLSEVSTARTRLEREFDADALGALKAASAQDLAIAGPSLAAEAFGAGLVDACELYIAPIAVGGGKPAFQGGVPVRLELADQRSFGNGAVYLHYNVKP